MEYTNIGGIYSQNWYTEKIHWYSWTCDLKLQLPSILIFNTFRKEKKMQNINFTSFLTRYCTSIKNIRIFLKLNSILLHNCKKYIFPSHFNPSHAGPVIWRFWRSQCGYRHMTVWTWNLITSFKRLIELKWISEQYKLSTEC